MAPLSQWGSEKGGSAKGLKIKFGFLCVSSLLPLLGYNVASARAVIARLLIVHFSLDLEAGAALESGNHNLLGETRLSQGRDSRSLACMPAR